MSVNVSDRATGDSGAFQWFKGLQATDEAVMVLNDQPILFTILLVVLVTIILQITLIWYIHYATLKPEQKKKDGKKGQGGLMKFLPSALRR